MQYRQNSGAGALPLSLLVPGLFKKSSSSRLLFQTRKIFSPPKGMGGCAVRISVVFLTPASQCLWKQGPESKGWSRTMCGWEPYEASSNQWISALIGSQARSFQTRFGFSGSGLSTPGLPVSPPSSGSPYQLCQCGSSDCILGSTQSSAHAFHVCPTASLTPQMLDLPFHGHRDPLFMQRTHPVPCHPMFQNLGNKY